MFQITSDAGFVSLSAPVMLQVVDGYDWPLLVVFLLLVASFMVILRALRAAVDSLAAVSLKLGIGRGARLHNSRTNPGNSAVLRQL